MLHSVRVRITIAAVLVTVVAVGAAGWLLVRSVEDSQLRQVRDDIEARLDQVSARLEQGRSPQEAAEGNGTAPLVQISDEQGDLVGSGPAFVQNGQVQVVGFDGNASFSVSGEEPPDAGDAQRPLPLPPVGPDPEPGGTQTEEEGTPGAEVLVKGFYTGPMEAVSREVDTPEGRLTVSAAAPVQQVAHGLDALRSRLLLGVPLLVVLVGAVAWMVVGRALRPVEAIRAEVHEITGASMHRRVPEPATGDEIGRLARTMNAMLRRLDRTATRQRQFISDASHELRSPVAAIRTTVEVARHKGDEADWPAVADTVLAEEARLEELLDDLLLLAGRDENGGSASGAEPVDLVAVTVAEAERSRSTPVQVTTHQSAGRGGWVTGNPRDLRRAVSNLLDNATRHARSAVEARVVVEGGTARLTVDDDGPGIPEADRQRVFERFTRLDDSRTRGTGGAGLGLAVARSIVTGQGGRIWAAASPLGGARLVIELPEASGATGADQEE